MKITVQTVVNAELNKIWNYWTKPEHIIHWNFANNEWCCPSAINEIKSGGIFNWRMESKDGKMGFDFAGTYDRVIDQKLIAYKLADDRVVTIQFIQNKNTVTVSETFDAEGTHADEQQRAGWQAILENFKNYVEAN